jgi:hypothetical protein
MLLEAKELCERMNLAEVSQRMLGYDIRQRQGIVEDASPVDYRSVPFSPTKSPSKRRKRFSQTPDEQVVNSTAAQVVLELENVILSYMSLEAFQVSWEALELYDSTFPDTFLRMANGFFRHKSSADADESQVEVLLHEMHMSIEQATENAEGLVDKAYGVLTQKSTRKYNNYYTYRSLSVTNLCVYSRRRKTPRLHPTYLLPGHRSKLHQCCVLREPEDRSWSATAKHGAGHPRCRGQFLARLLYALAPHHRVSRCFGLDFRRNGKFSDPC